VSKLFSPLPSPCIELPNSAPPLPVLHRMASLYDRD
jgi:hypothetical protein